MSSVVGRVVTVTVRVPACLLFVPGVVLGMSALLAGTELFDASGADSR